MISIPCSSPFPISPFNLPFLTASKQLHFPNFCPVIENWMEIERPSCFPFNSQPFPVTLLSIWMVHHQCSHFMSPSLMNTLMNLVLSFILTTLSLLSLSFNFTVMEGNGSSAIVVRTSIFFHAQPITSIPISNPHFCSHFPCQWLVDTTKREEGERLIDRRRKGRRRKRRGRRGRGQLFHPKYDGIKWRNEG